MKQWLRGKKTYIVALSGIITATLGYVNDTLTLVQFIEALFLATGAITIRSAIAKV